MTKKHIAMLAIISTLVLVSLAPSVGAADPCPCPCARTLAEMLVAGHYDRVDPFFIEVPRFPVKPERFTTAGTKLFHFDTRPTTAEVEAKMREEGYEPATIEHLLAYGAAYPEEQRKHPIFALGSFWVGQYGERRVPALYGIDRERGLCLDWGGPERMWVGHDRFLAVRKSGVSASTATTSPRTLSEMLAAGRHDWVNPSITENEKHFPVKPERFTTAGTKLFHFDKRMTSAEAEAAIRKAGYEPATIEYLLAYSVEHPEEQRKFPIHAIGSSWVFPFGDRGVPYLYGWDYGGRRERGVNLGWARPKDQWLEECRFLAVRKPSP